MLDLAIKCQHKPLEGLELRSWTLCLLEGYCFPFLLFVHNEQVSGLLERQIFYLLVVRKEVRPQYGFKGVGVERLKLLKYFSVPHLYFSFYLPFCESDSPFFRFLLPHKYLWKLGRLRVRA